MPIRCQGSAHITGRPISVQTQRGESFPEVSKDIAVCASKFGLLRSLSAGQSPPKFTFGVCLADAANDSRGLPSELRLSGT